MSKHYFQNILKDISFEKLLSKWQGFNLMRFLKHTFEKREKKYGFKTS